VPRLREIPTKAWIALVLILVAGGGIRAYEAVKPVARLSEDAKSYTSIGKNVAKYGDFPQGVSSIRWPPGTPYMFGLAYRLAPQQYSEAGQYAPARWAQFIVATGTILSVFLLGWLLAGPWAGVLAAAFLAFYPPLWWGPSNLLSEPLGAFFVTTAFAALAAAFRSRLWWWFAISGAVFGCVLLTRTDLLFVPALLTLLVLGVVWHWSGWRKGLIAAASLAIATAIVITPWTIHASIRAGRFVPITQGGGSAFFVGTYLPGNGSTYGLKLAIRKDIVKKYPQYKNTYYKDIPGKIALNTIAARHPELARDNALLTEAKSNLKDAVLHHPGHLVKLWWTKFKKMWFRASLGGAHHPMPVLRTYHTIVMLLAIIGLWLGLIRRRDPVIAAILIGLSTATAIHLLAVANGRYGLPLMGILFAGGVAGWWTLGADLLAKRRAGPDGEAEDEPEGESGSADAPAPAPDPAPLS
jgi:4-amino-4-deoxy-L-arabinose transferase-like glycosyltransferase